MNNYWGSPNDYKTVLYISFEWARPSFEIFRDVSQLEDNTNVKTFESVTEVSSFYTLFAMPMLPTLYSIPLHDVVELENLDTGQSFTLSNMQVEDTGEDGTKLAVQKISAQLTVISASSGCGDQGYIKVSC
jgi:hypothetical protein